MPSTPQYQYLDPEALSRLTAGHPSPPEKRSHNHRLWLGAN